MPCEDCVSPLRRGPPWTRPAMPSGKCREGASSGPALSALAWSTPTRVHVSSLDGGCTCAPRIRTRRRWVP
eukprot:159010-Alexandrium_andersonii.AAC.1